MPANPAAPEALRKLIGNAIYDPGQLAGYKGERTLTDWQVDAVMAALATRLPSAEVALREEVAFLVRRLRDRPHGTARWTGLSSDAIVDLAFGGEGGRLPLDQNDLSACYLTVMRLPDHLVTAAVLDRLEEGERAVGDIDWARANAGWSDETASAMRARAALAGEGR